MYHGKESYNEKVDIFSFAMLIYEMITFRIPFEHLTPSQANQANENGARPTLKRMVSYDVCVCVYTCTGGVGALMNTNC